MKTAMQELIEWCESKTQIFVPSKSQIIEKCNSLIEKERQQIIDAYWGGLNGSINDYSESYSVGSILKGIKTGEGGELYYKETFKKN